MKFLRLAFFIALIILLLSAVFVFINRDSLFNYSINRLIKNLTPAYIEIDDVAVDLGSGSITVKNFKIINPKGYNSDYLIEVPLIKANFNQKDQKSILKGLTVYDIELVDPVVYFERSADGKVNIQRLQEVFVKPVRRKEMTLKNRLLAGFSYLLSPVKDISELMSIDPRSHITNGRLVFDDRYFASDGYLTVLSGVDADVELGLKKGFKGMDWVRSSGNGLLNSKPGQVIAWVCDYDPNAPKLTMSNRFILQGIDFIHFRPYFDRYSPFLFKKGLASGELIVNFDNADIGSMNEVRFSQLDFAPKEDAAQQRFWEASIEDLHKYFSSQPGEILFDFKVKGSMDEPKFYLGSKTKSALRKMLIGKITDIFNNAQKDSQPSAAGESATGQAAPQEASGPKSDVEKIIDLFKSLKS